MRILRDSRVPALFLLLGAFLTVAIWCIVSAPTLGQQGPAENEGNVTPATEPEAGVSDADPAQQDGGGFGQRWPNPCDAFRSGARRVWVKFTLISLEPTECRPVVLASGRRLDLQGDNAELTQAEALDLLTRLRALPSFEVVGSASGVNSEGSAALFQFIEELRYRSAERRDEGYAERDIGVRIQFTPKVSADGTGIILEKVFIETSLPAGWRRAADGAPGEALQAGWLVETEMTVPNGGCLVIAGLDPQILDDAGPAAKRFAGRKGVLLVAAKLLPTIERTERAPAHEQSDTENAHGADETDF